MSTGIYRYIFGSNIPPQEIEGTLHLAILAAESLHGQSQVRLDASYCMDPDKRTCVVDALTDVGRDIVNIFTGFAIREFGEDAFSVRCVDPTSNPQSAVADGEPSQSFHDDSKTLRRT